MNILSFFLVVGSLAVPALSLAQEEPNVIRVKKESTLAKLVFDNTQNKLVIIDRYGNPRENKVLSYRLFIKNGRTTREFVGYGNKLNDEISSYLSEQKSAVKLFFTEIKVYDDNEHIQSLPDCIEVWFPECVNCSPKKMKKRS